MAGKKIGELTPLGRNLIATDELELSLSGSAGSRKVTGAQLTAGLQPTLVSGTNIKTVNSTSLLGSGDVAVQPTLVSGTNIKTVNSTSLLGSGDVAVQPTLVSGTNIKTVNSTSLLGSGDVAVQPTLVSGTNIKTINGSSVLGSGNLVISGGVTSVTGTSPIVSSGGTTPAISIATANTSTTGALTSTDWNTFNNKQAALVSGTNIKTVNGSSLLGSGNLVVGGNKLTQAITDVTQNIAASGATNTLMYSANIISAYGQIIDIDCMVRNTTGSTINIPRFRIYSNTTNSLTGATQLSFYDMPSTSTIYRFYRRFVTATNTGAPNLIGMDFNLTGNDFITASQQVYSEYNLGSFIGQRPWILITLNNSGQLITTTIEY